MSSTTVRQILPGLPVPGRGIEGAEFPLTHLIDGLDNPRRVVISLLSRWNNKEDLRDTAKRIQRYGKLGSIPLLNDVERDRQCDPIDLVMIVAGLIWPGLETWRKVKGERSHTLLLDLWWGPDGMYPGAAILRDGVLHFVHMDRETDQFWHSEWMEWQQENWQGPVLHHAIQFIRKDHTDTASPIIQKISAHPRSKRGCVIWSSASGMNLRAHRVDLAKGKAFLTPLCEGFRVGSIPEAPLPLRVEMVKMAAFQNWIEGLEVPEEIRATPPIFSVMNIQKPAKRAWGGREVAAGGQNHAEQTPLFPEEVAASETPNPLLVKEFGEGITSKTDPARIAAMHQTAKESLLRATASMQPAKIDHWRSVLNEIEKANNRQA